MIHVYYIVCFLVFILFKNVMNENFFYCDLKKLKIIIKCFLSNDRKIDYIICVQNIYTCPKVFCLLVIITTKSHHYLPNKILNQTEIYGNPKNDKIHVFIFWIFIIFYSAT